MKKILTKAILSSVCLCAMTAPIISCAKQQDINITDIELYIDSQYLMPGDVLQVRAIIQPYNVRYRDLIWEIAETPSSDITINQSGELFIPFTTPITKPEKLVIKASSPFNRNVFKMVEVYVLPYSDSDFAGFENDELQYIDRQGQVQSMKIIKKDEYHYESEKYIDIFEMYNPPKPFSSLIHFTPIVRGEISPYMQFNLKGGAGEPHVISWNEYEDGTWTKEIPDFTAYNNYLLFDEIEVHFACNENIVLNIKFEAWQGPADLNSGRITYSPEPNNPHRLVNEILSAYSCHAFAQSKVSDIGEKQYMHNILFFRPKYEYTEFVIQLDMVQYPKDSPLYEESIEMQKCFHYELNSRLVTRECDHYRYYVVDLCYWFDSSERIHDASYWDYSTIDLFKIGATDPMFHDPSEHNYCTTCDFYIDWI